jgi:hypothetical protein
MKISMRKTERSVVQMSYRHYFKISNDESLSLSPYTVRPDFAEGETASRYGE